MWVASWAVSKFANLKYIFWKFKTIFLGFTQKKKDYLGGIGDSDYVLCMIFKSFQMCQFIWWLMQEFNLRSQ